MQRYWRYAALVAVVGFIGIGMGAGISGCSGMRGHSAQDIRAHTGERLDRLHDELKLSSAQESGWIAFRDRVSAQTGKASDGLRSLREAPASATTIERLERGKQAITEGQGVLEEVLAATRTFYATLRPEQQTRFDEATRRLMPGRFGHHRRPAAASA